MRTCISIDINFLLYIATYLGILSEQIDVLATDYTTCIVDAMDPRESEINITPAPPRPLERSLVAMARIHYETYYVSKYARLIHHNAEENDTGKECVKSRA